MTKKFKLEHLRIHPLGLYFRMPLFHFYGIRILEINGTYWNGRYKDNRNIEKETKRFNKILLELGLYTIDYTIVGQIFFVPFKLNLKL